MGNEAPFFKLIKDSKATIGGGNNPVWHGKTKPNPKPDENGWVVVGYKEGGNPIQKNINTGEIRVLEKWVEIFKTESINEK